MEHFDRPRQVLAMSLAGLAGFVDATGFLLADRYFVSFMSGNTTRLGVDVWRDGAHARVLALLILGFVVGVAAGSVAASHAGRWRKPAVLGLVATLLLMATLLATGGLPASALGLLVLAMGALNNTFQRDGQIAFGLTYMTGALVRLGQALGGALAGERRSPWLGYLVLWLALGGGACLGALAYTRLGPANLWLATGVTALLAAFACRLPTSAART